MSILSKYQKQLPTDMEMVRRVGKSGAVISRLMDGLLGKGYNK